MKKTPLYHKEFGDREYPIEELEESIKLMKEHGVTHFYVGFHALRDNPYLEMSRHELMLEDVTAEMLQGEYNRLYDDGVETAREIYGNWLNDVKKGLIFDEDYTLLSLDSKLKKGKLTKALLRILKLDYKLKNKTELTLFLLERVKK